MSALISGMKANRLSAAESAKTNPNEFSSRKNKDLRMNEGLVRGAPAPSEAAAFSQESCNAVITCVPPAGERSGCAFGSHRFRVPENFLHLISFFPIKCDFPDQIFNVLDVRLTSQTVVTNPNRGCSLVL